MAQTRNGPYSFLLHKYQMNLLFVVLEYLRQLFSNTYEPRDLIPLIGVLLLAYFIIALVGLGLDHVISIVFSIGARQ